jgi:hypothetical protein
MGRATRGEQGKAGSDGQAGERAGWRLQYIIMFYNPQQLNGGGWQGVAGGADKGKVGRAGGRAGRQAL